MTSDFLASGAEGYAFLFFTSSEGLSHPDTFTGVLWKAMEDDGLKCAEKGFSVGTYEDGHLVLCSSWHGSSVLSHHQEQGKVGAGLVLASCQPLPLLCKPDPLQPVCTPECTYLFDWPIFLAEAFADPLVL